MSDSESLCRRVPMAEREFQPVRVIAAPCPGDTESRRWRVERRVPSSASPVVGESLRQLVPVATSPFVGESLHWLDPMSASPCICESLRWFGQPLDLRSSVSPFDCETLRWQVPATASPVVGDSRRRRVPSSASLGDSLQCLHSRVAFVG